MIGKNRVVITGIGVLAANGIGKDAFWKSLLAGESGIGPVTLFDASDLPCKIAGEVKGFNPFDFIDPAMKPRRMGRFSQLGVAATNLALKDSNIHQEDICKFDRLRVVMGVATSDIDLVVKPPKLYSTPSLVPHAVTSAISRYLNIKCELTTLSNACSSGLDSIAMAADLIRNGKTDIALAGSAEASITYTTLRSLSAAGMLSDELNERPKTASCPFSYQRKGGLLAEGAAILALETLDRARERDARIYAEVLGHGNWMHPNQREDGNALVYAMKSAINNSGIHATDVDYINAHAPSDPILDRVETNSIKYLFAGRAYAIPVSSIKGITGNPFACGGSLQAIATSLALHHGMLPPTANYEITDPYCDLDYIPNIPRRAEATLAMVNSRGIGGGNSSMILQKWKGM